MIYILSFLVVLSAEIFGTLRDLFLQQKRIYISAVLNGFTAGLWCVKIAIVANQYLTVITGLAAAIFGSIIGAIIHQKYIT